MQVEPSDSLSAGEKIEKPVHVVVRPDGRRHHHVPQFLMRRFATERKAGKFQTQAFDKHKDVVFTAALENIMVGQDYNAVERDGQRVTFEPMMGIIENDAAEVISAIIANGHLKDLTEQDRTVVYIFSALQFLRGPATRNLYVVLAEEILSRTKEMIGAGMISDGLPMQNEAKAAALGVIFESLGDVAQLFANKELFLMRAAEGHHFILGDTPVTMMNDREFGPYRNIGLSVPGIQIHLPLSPDFCLGFWCSSVLEPIRETVDRYALVAKRLKATAIISRPDVARKVLAQLAPAEAPVARLDKLLAPFLTGSAMELTSDNVTRYNALQVEFAQRWVISKTGQFDLPRRMIADNPKYREGIKPRF